MPSIIPNYDVMLANVKGTITTPWFQFLSGLATIINSLVGVTPTVVLTATATLDFPNTAANAVSDLTVSVPGALVGDVVVLGIPATSVPTGGTYVAWVSAADVVTVRFVNNTAAALNPAAGSFTVVITRY